MMVDEGPTNATVCFRDDDIEANKTESEDGENTLVSRLLRQLKEKDEEIAALKAVASARTTTARTDRRKRRTSDCSPPIVVPTMPRSFTFQRDSPEFTSSIDTQFDDFHALASFLRNVRRATKGFRDAIEAMGKTSITLSQAMHDVPDVSPRFSKEIAPLLQYTKWFRQCLKELNTSQDILAMTLLHGLESPLRNFVDDRSATLLSARKRLNRSRNAYEQACAKFMQMRIDGGADSRSNRETVALKTWKTFERNRFEAVAHLNDASVDVAGSVNESILSALYAVLVYFEHCTTHTLKFEDVVRHALDTVSKSMTNAYKSKREANITRRRMKMENRLRDVSRFVLMHTNDSRDTDAEGLSNERESSDRASQRVHHSGYLFSKSVDSTSTTGQIMREWKRRWFSIDNSTNELRVHISEIASTKQSNRDGRVRTTVRVVSVCPTCPPSLARSRSYLSHARLDPQSNRS